MTSAGRGVRLGGAYYEIVVEDGIPRAMQQAEREAKAGSAKIAAALAAGNQQAAQSAAALERSMSQAAAATRRTEASLAGLAKTGAGLGVGLIGIASAADIASKGLDRIVSSTQAAAQANFALSKTYGASTAQMQAFSKQFADQIGRSTTEVTQAAVVVGNLTKEYGLNQAQAQQLITVSADLAAVYGKD